MDLKTFLQSRVWPILKSVGINSYGFGLHLARRMDQDRVKVTAGYMAYVTVLSLVPLMTVFFAALSTFPIFDEIRGVVEDFVFSNFVPASGDVVKNHISGFLENTNKMTAMGGAILVVVALLLISAVDRNLNHIWRTRKKRSRGVAFAIYWMILSFGPLALGSSIALTSYVVSLTMFSESGLLTYWQKALSLLPFLFSTAAFIVLYTVVPNTRVKIRHAWIGALSAAVLFELSKKGFALYVASFPSYQAIYGALAAIPILLIWIYVSWIIVLVGAEITASLGEYQRLRARAFISG